MTTTINVTDNGQVELPKEFRRRKKIKAGMPLRVTDVGEGIYREIACRLAGTFPAVNPEPWLKWIEAKARVYEPAPLGKQRSRDADDDPFLACALASGEAHRVERR